MRVEPRYGVILEKINYLCLFVTIIGSNCIFLSIISFFPPLVSRRWGNPFSRREAGCLRPGRFEKINRNGLIFLLIHLKIIPPSGGIIFNDSSMV